MKAFLLSFCLAATSLVAPVWSQSGSYTQQPYSSSIRWYQNYQEALNASQQSSKPILILFTGTRWCPACIHLERTVLRDPLFAQGVGSKFIFLKAEFERSDDDYMDRESPFADIKNRFSIRKWPTFIVADKNGNKLFQVDYQQTGTEAYVQKLLQGLSNISQVQATDYYDPQTARQSTM